MIVMFGSIEAEEKNTVTKTKGQNRQRQSIIFLEQRDFESSKSVSISVRSAVTVLLKISPNHVL